MHKLWFESLHYSKPQSLTTIQKIYFYSSQKIIWELLNPWKFGGEGDMPGPTQLICLCLEGSMRIEKQRRDGWSSWEGISEYCDRPLFISPNVYIRQSRKEGEGKRLLYQDTKNKTVTFLISKTSSNWSKYLRWNLLSVTLKQQNAWTLWPLVKVNESTSVGSHRDKWI